MAEAARSIITARQASTRQMLLPWSMCMSCSFTIECGGAIRFSLTVGPLVTLRFFDPVQI
jgi:hypothetical protein